MGLAASIPDVVITMSCHVGSEAYSLEPNYRETLLKREALFGPSRINTRLLASATAEPEDHWLITIEAVSITL